MTTLFPSAMIVMSLGAAAVYAAYGPQWKAIYWLAAAALTASVTFGDSGT